MILCQQEAGGDQEGDLQTVVMEYVSDAPSISTVETTESNSQIYTHTLSRGTYALTVTAGVPTGLVLGAI